MRRDRLLRMQALLAQLLAASFSSDELCVVQSRWARGDLLYPPHGPRFKRVMGWLRRLA
ncbi:MAG: hypothetical protein Q8K05_03830 [Polaromonas sp.]|uniref:hypothetical protein n=1 Tax=Polaromonas sp. TaxID=1869339 RepID=UPI00272F4F91|nr:hypothetical protein [Polaromonas sp.]MDP2255176.1 hypothetical protein [Polaromonas sp.]